MYLLIIILPLIGTVTSLLFGRFLGIGGPIITIMNMSISLLLSIMLAYEVIFQYCPVTLKLYNYIDFELIDANIEFVFDQLSVSMLFIIILISLLVHIYSLEYMSSDPNLTRFLGYLSLFTFMMILMVTSNNYFQLFFGWEGVGLASYLLINFWFSRIAANKAAFKAVVYNRFGDLALILALLLIFKVFKSFDFEIINAELQSTDWSGPNYFNLFLIGLFLIIAALAKSAQIGLHAWLPDAMEGPTPVSALLHAATLVTAGIYLLIRSQSFFILIPNLLITLTFIGSLTAFFAASTGLTQNDLKKIIAYSTCSQLGYMFLACGNGQFSISFFHLINHAFFKALLFLAAGCVIHAWNGRQDIRYMGHAINFLPFTYSSFLIGSLALMGFPFLTGFYSKDLIIETAFGSYLISSYFSFWLALFTAFLTAFYSTRLLYYTFVSSPFSPSDRPIINPPVESTSLNISLMSLPLFILSFFSIFFGYLAKDLFVGIGTPIFSAPHNFDSEFLDPLVRLYPNIFSACGLLCALFVYTNRNYSVFQFVPNFITSLYWFINGKWFFDTLSAIFSNYFLLFSYLIPFKSLDRGFIELVGPTGLSKFSGEYWLSASLNYQTGFINDFIFGILSVTTAMLILLFNSSAEEILPGLLLSSFKIISLIAISFLLWLPKSIH
jgi:NADH-ubiquinone oxidoreductase chain 5